MTNEEIRQKADEVYSQTFPAGQPLGGDLRWCADQYAMNLARALVAQAYEETIHKAQEIRDTLHLRPLFDDANCSGADTAAEEIQEFARALKDALGGKE